MPSALRARAKPFAALTFMKVLLVLGSGPGPLRTAPRTPARPTLSRTGRPSTATDLDGNRVDHAVTVDERHGVPTGRRLPDGEVGGGAGKRAVHAPLQGAARAACLEDETLAGRRDVRIE